MRRAAVLLLLLLVVLEGCTQASTAKNDFKGEEKRVAQVVLDLSSNATAAKAAESCDQLLSKGLRGRVGGKQCASELKKAFDDADARGLDVKQVTISGATATADVTAKNGDTTIKRTFKLVDEDQRWRLDSFG